MTSKICYTHLAKNGKNSAINNVCTRNCDSKNCTFFQILAHSDLIFILFQGIPLNSSKNNIRLAKEFPLPGKQKL